MLIGSLKLQNYRRIVRMEQRFNPSMNVIVGANGTGKTTLLDALAFALASVVASLTDYRTRPPLGDHDARRVRYDKGGVVTKELMWPVAVSCEGSLDGRSLLWGRRFGHDGEWRVGWRTPSGGTGVSNGFYDEDLRNAGAELREAISRGEDRVLPLVAYFPTDRLWRSDALDKTEVLPPGSRLRGYDRWSAPDGRARRLAEWFKTRVLVELQTSKKQPVLTAARETIRRCVEGCTDVTWDVNSGELVFTFEDTGPVEFALLSDGQRALCAMVGDLVYRCVELNPQLGERAPLETPGVVLIDEVDLHLHPNWQRRVVADLRRSFPKVQFFLTTHSPFIVQSLAADEVIALSGPAHLDEAPYKQGVEEVAEGVLGVTDVARSERFREMEAAAKTFIELLERADGREKPALDEARRRYLELVVRYADDPAFLATLAVEGALRGVRLDSTGREGAR